MSNNKILFTDLDGTLLNDDHRITTENKQTIQKALKHGHKVAIATGRPLSSGIILAKELDLTMPGCYTIAYNGGFIYDNAKEETIYESRIPLDYVLHIFEEAKNYGIHCQTYSDQELIGVEHSKELKRYFNSTNIPYQVVDDLRSALSKDPGKVIVISYDPIKLKGFEDIIAPWAKGKVDYIYSNAHFLEFVNPGVSKGSAIKKLCQMLDIPMEHTISAGDAPNDISMLTTTHVAAVMANATKEMKQYGTYITTNDNNHSGVAEVIKKFML
ncbi:MAG TPA: HAD family phosphatase [Candidatus Merdenecus merdavium]|nr:HAD family phosphatase [Candidatus Merdenecus merdavium]